MNFIIYPCIQGLLVLVTISVELGTQNQGACLELGASIARLIMDTRVCVSEPLSVVCVFFLFMSTGSGLDPKLRE